MHRNAQIKCMPVLVTATCSKHSSDFYFSLCTSPPVWCAGLPPLAGFSRLCSLLAGCCQHRSRSLRSRGGRAAGTIRSAPERCGHSHCLEREVDAEPNRVPSCSVLQSPARPLAGAALLCLCSSASGRAGISIRQRCWGWARAAARTHVCGRAESVIACALSRNPSTRSVARPQLSCKQRGR